ncbi:MAG: hypothetical protein PHC66_04895 [Candidatus Nanoarchaeia archaeon]|nr:hypothetical protein [Candidatus Nanoarchaeia archaeon]MDD5239825.1 hypothetical protein [Candidatus Nanoarchaeia archaeon]
MALTLIGEAHPEELMWQYHLAKSKHELFAGSDFGKKFVNLFEQKRTFGEIDDSYIQNLNQTLNDESYVMSKINGITVEETKIIDEIKPDVIVLESIGMKKRFPLQNKIYVEGVLQVIKTSFMNAYYSETGNWHEKMIKERDSKFVQKIDEILERYNNVVGIFGAIHMPGICEKSKNTARNIFFVPENLNVISALKDYLT